MTTSLRMICLIVLTMMIASPVWADAGKSDTAKNTSNDIVHPSYDIFRFHEWIMPLRIKYGDIQMAWFRGKVPMSVPLEQMRFKVNIIETVDDYLALVIYYKETKYSDFVIFRGLLENIRVSIEMKKTQAILRVVLEERARQGLCDELLQYYKGGVVFEHSRYVPDFTAFFNCMEKPDEHWQGAENTRIIFLKKVTEHLVYLLSRLPFDNKNQLDFEKVKSIKNIVYISNDPQEVLGIFFDLWENRAKEGLGSIRRDHEHLRERAPELLKQYGPYPKPGWTAQIAKIRSKTMKEWDKHFRIKMGKDGQPWRLVRPGKLINGRFDTGISPPKSHRILTDTETKKPQPSATSNEIVYPSHDIFRFHEWIMPLRIQCWEMQQAWYRSPHERPIPQNKMMFSPDIIQAVDDYLALEIYLKETNYNDSGFLLRLLRDVHRSKEFRNNKAIVRVMIEERARMGLCDELLNYYRGGPLSMESGYLPDFGAFFTCMKRPANMWSGGENTKTTFLKNITEHLIYQMLLRRIPKEDRLGYEKAEKLKGIIQKSNNSKELQGIFFDLWNNRAREILASLRRGHEHLRKQAPELLKQYGPYPKPGWTEQIAKIRSKTMEQWESHFRSELGKEDVSWKEKYGKSRMRKRYGFGMPPNEIIDNNPNADAKKQQSPKVSAQEPAANPYLPVVIIIAVLSALIVSVLVIRRRGQS